MPPPPVGSTDASDNFGCPPGTVFWMRDTLTPLCTPACSSDADCGPDDGRCRLLDVEDRSPAPPMLLVDDMAPEDVDAALNDPTKLAPPVTLCDPFFDIAGATDADAPAATPIPTVNAQVTP